MRAFVKIPLLVINTKLICVINIRYSESLFIGTFGCGRSTRITHSNTYIRTLKGEWGHSMLDTIWYILVTLAQVDSVARGLAMSMRCSDGSAQSFDPRRRMVWPTSLKTAALLNSVGCASKICHQHVKCSNVVCVFIIVALKKAITPCEYCTI